MPSVTQLPLASAGAVSWTEFDAGWYRAAYGIAGGTDAAALAFYLETGQALRHAPNPFFDENWYLRVHPDVAHGVNAGYFRSGFDHYIQNPLENRAPHWMFDPAFHHTQRPDLTLERLREGGFANEYDHFLRRGHADGDAPSLFFSGEFYRSRLDAAAARGAEAEGAYRHYLRRFRISLPDMQVSRYFDPSWYLGRYPEISAEVARGIWRGALDHYLSNATPLAFDPLPGFSEQYYLQRNPDVADAIGQPGGIRSGYHHFIRHGAGEGRAFNPGIQPAESPGGRAAPRSCETCGPRLLFLEDTVPCREIGSGYARSHDIVVVLAEMGWQVTVFPVHARRGGMAAMHTGLPDGVEVMHDHSIDGLREFLQSRTGYYDCVWVSRPRNLDRIRDILIALRAVARPFVVLDANAIATLRYRQTIALDSALLPFDPEDAMKAEFGNAALCDAILAVNDEQAEALRRIGLGAVSVLGHARDLRLTPTGFGDRHGLLFVAGKQGAAFFDYDALCWFVDHVLPLARMRLGGAVGLTIAGAAAGDRNFARFASRPGVTLAERVDDPEPLYSQHRVFVAPADIETGPAYKIHEAAAFGLPVVASRVLCDPLGWRDGEEMLVADRRERTGFADRIAALYRSESLWLRLRQGAADRLARETNRAAYRRGLEDVLARPLLMSASRPACG